MLLNNREYKVVEVSIASILHCNLRLHNNFMTASSYESRASTFVYVWGLTPKQIHYEKTEECEATQLFLDMHIKLVCRYDRSDRELTLFLQVLVSRHPLLPRHR